MVVTVKTWSIDEQIQEAKASLERINEWIHSCDSKAGTIFALIGVLLTIIFTNDQLAVLYRLLKRAFLSNPFYFTLFFGFFIIAVGALIYGISHLIFVLIAKIDIKVYSENKLETNSVLFFGSISKRQSYQVFQSDVLKQDKEAYLNDLLSQIYINSKIANKKHENYNYR